MLKAARELFPDAGNYERPEYWAGLRPMTPDNLPIFGRGSSPICGSTPAMATWAGPGPADRPGSPPT